jgi:hypothetical protein
VVICPAISVTDHMRDGGHQKRAVLDLRMMTRIGARSS